MPSATACDGGAPCRGPVACRPLVPGILRIASALLACLGAAEAATTASWSPPEVELAGFALEGIQLFQLHAHVLQRNARYNGTMNLSSRLTTADFELSHAAASRLRRSRTPKRAAPRQPVAAEKEAWEVDDAAAKPQTPTIWTFVARLMDVVSSRFASVQPPAADVPKHATIGTALVITAFFCCCWFTSAVAIVAWVITEAPAEARAHGARCVRRVNACGTYAVTTSANVATACVRGTLNLPHVVNQLAVGQGTSETRRWVQI
mmetsp:Transcript_95682/g.270786  ORF Transcript_95682/g.270786 Transcript_95682/m.270786 type:complete len:263 (+) Transcript_95682:188-976(+)